MAAYDYDLGVIGGGAAGLTAAAGGAQFGARTILIEKSPINWAGIASTWAVSPRRP